MLIDADTTPITITKTLGGYEWKIEGREDLYGYIDYWMGFYDAIHADDAGELNIPHGIGQTREAAVRELLLFLDEEGRLNDTLEVEAAGLDALAANDDRE